MSRRLLFLSLLTIAAVACANNGAVEDAGPVGAGNPSAQTATAAPVSGEAPTVGEPDTDPAPTVDPDQPDATPGETPPASPEPTSTPLPPSPGQPEPTPAAAERLDATIYLLAPASDPGDTPVLVAVHREIAATAAVGRASIEALLAGPDPAEVHAGLVSEVPAGTVLLDLDISQGVATVDLSGDFEAGGGTASMTARLAQLVYTITQFPSVDVVSLRLDGRPVSIFSGEGLVLDTPVGRDDYRDLLPSIFVESPAWGETLPAPARLVGEAAVYEAVFHVEVLDAGGVVVARPDYVMTDNGTGWGRFDVTLPYSVAGPQDGTLRVWAYSAEDGSVIHELSIPVTLTP